MHSSALALSPGPFRERCIHCASVIPPRSPSEFCCSGCEFVYGLLQARGLQEYYRLRGPAQKGSVHTLVLRKLERYEYLDDPAFRQEYATQDGLVMRFYLEGAHCAACVWLTEKLPNWIPEVESLHLDLSNGVAVVRLKGRGSFAEAARELVRLGYRPHPVKGGESQAFRILENRQHLIKMAVAGAASGNIMLLAIALYAGVDGRMAEVFCWVSLLLYLPVLFYSATPFYQSAWASLRKREVSIDVPIVFGLWMGTVVSVLNLVQGSPHIYFDSLSTIVFLLLATRYLLRKVHQRALGTTEVMHFLAPSQAMRRTANGEGFEKVNTDALKVGDSIQVLPQECFPVDGTVTDGESSVNCALLTGESRLVHVAFGSLVRAGTLNQRAPLIVSVTQSGVHTRLGQILQSMEQGMRRKAPMVSYLDQVGQVFVVAVLVLTAVGFVLGLAHGWQEAVNRALAVAIIVCPCTFALATPLAFSLALSRCAKNGILVKGADVIERLSRIKTIFFDKTGTLTVGELEVLSWQALAEGAEEALLALESRSSHPIAQAVQRHFSQSERFSRSSLEVSDFEEIPGRGLRGTIGGKRYALGRFGKEISAQPGSEEILTRVGLYEGEELVGRLELGDQVRADSLQGLELLRALPLTTKILSGDSEAPVRAVADLLRFPVADRIALASPEEKVRYVTTSPNSLMVGDGANDAPALASAFASVAVQGGMEVSLRASGAYSSRPGVMPIYPLLVVARQTMRVIRRNLVFTVIYNVVGISVAITGHLSPLIAAVLMPMSAITVFFSTIVGTPRLRNAFGEKNG